MWAFLLTLGWFHVRQTLGRDVRVQLSCSVFPEMMLNSLAQYQNLSISSAPIKLSFYHFWVQRCVSKVRWIKNQTMETFLFQGSACQHNVLGFFCVPGKLWKLMGLWWTGGFSRWFHPIPNWNLFINKILVTLPIENHLCGEYKLWFHETHWILLLLFWWKPALIFCYSCFNWRKTVHFMLRNIQEEKKGLLGNSNERKVTKPKFLPLH